MTTDVKAATGDAKAVTGRPYEQEDVSRSQHVVNGILSPDGSCAVYQLSETVPGKTKDEDQQLSSLWRIELAGGKPKRLTAKGKNAASAQFTPDGRSVLFLSARDSAGSVAQIYRLPLDGGEAEDVTSLEQGVASFALSPDGEWIAFSALKGTPQPPGPNDHVRISRFAYRFDPIAGYLQDTARAIYLMSSKGGEHKALTAHDGVVVEMVWSPDNREIAAFIIGKAAQTSWAAQGELCIVDREGHEKQLLDGMTITNPFWTADGKQIGYIGRADNFSRQPQLYLIDRVGGAPICRTSRLDLAVGGPIQVHSPAMQAKSRVQLTPDGACVIAPISKGGETGLYQIALSGKESCKSIIAGLRTCKVLDRAGETLLFSTQDCNTPSELWVADLTTGKERALTSHNAQWQSNIVWPQVEHVTVRSAPGVEIEGWVLKPSHGKAPFKTVLYIHGGPHSAFGYSFNEDFQELVGAGYAVAFANPRGSTGYGDTFSTAIISCCGYPETEDLNAFLDELVKRGITNPERLGVTGVSYGGKMSAWMIGQTDRFKAAVPEEGFYNMFSMYGVSDLGVHFITEEIGGPPQEQVQQYWDLSPIAHAHRCKTPTLLIQGENDLRCPMEEAEQLYMVLKHNGCEVEFLRLKNCNHALELYGPPPLRRFRMDAIKDWFDRHLG